MNLKSVFNQSLMVEITNDRHTNSIIHRNIQILLLIVEINDISYAFASNNVVEFWIYSICVGFLERIRFMERKEEYFFFIFVASNIFKLFMVC